MPRRGLAWELSRDPGDVDAQRRFELEGRRRQGGRHDVVPPKLRFARRQLATVSCSRVKVAGVALALDVAEAPGEAARDDVGRSAPTQGEQVMVRGPPAHHGQQRREVVAQAQKATAVQGGDSRGAAHLQHSDAALLAVDGLAVEAPTSAEDQMPTCRVHDCRRQGSDRPNHRPLHERRAASHC